MLYDNKRKSPDAARYAARLPCEPLKLTPILELATASESLKAEGLRLRIANDVIDSLQIDKQGIANLTIPSHCGDIFALEALNTFLKINRPQFGCDAVNVRDLNWYAGLQSVTSRILSEPRVIFMRPVVQGARSNIREKMAEILKKRGMKFADPIEQALTAAAYACKENGKDIFKGDCVRGSIPGKSLKCTRGIGFAVIDRSDMSRAYGDAVSGVPFL